MAITINGSGTVTGISVGGLPDGVVDAGTLAAGSAGLKLNYKTTLYTSISTAISSSTGNWQAGPFSVTITPSATSSKILVLCHVTGGVSVSGGEGPSFQVQRKIGSGSFSASDGIGDATGTSMRGTVGGLYDDITTSETLTYSAQFVDAPATTSAVEYKPYFHVENGDLLINRAGNNDSPEKVVGTSSITVIEVGAG
tara:strand:- start:1650 stop:2240 length:591 start_codon:yes stop_codon:yes gene_type:complete